MSETKTIVKVIKTRADKDDDSPVTTTLTIDFSNVTVDQVYEIAAKAEVILWQNAARKMAVIPAVATKVVGRPTGTGQIDYAQALVKLLGGDKAMLLIRKYGDGQKAYEAVKPLLDSMMEDIESAPDTTEG